MFRIEMLPARHGDGLLLEYGPAGRLSRILIDGGPTPAYDSLRARLDPEGSGVCHLELMVVTHVDADHIEGIVKLLGDHTLALTVGDLWFNAWKHLGAPSGDQLGPVQGEYLSALIGKRSLPWNQAFRGASVCPGPAGALPTASLPGGLTLTILSPGQPQLERLRKVWEKEVRAAGLDPGDPDAALARLQGDKRLRPRDMLGAQKLDVAALAASTLEPDRAEANGSSIAFLAEYADPDSHTTKRCLFLADAHPDVVETSLKRLNAERAQDRLRVDAVKLPHHGSKNNVSKEFLELVESPRFLVSTNGSYFDHPDPEALARVVRFGGNRPRLCFNYRSEQTGAWEAPLLQANERYEVEFPAHGSDGLAVEL